MNGLNNGGGDQIEISLPARAEYIGAVRLFVSGVASRLGFDYDDIEDIKLAVAEACTNVIRHAYDGVSHGKLYIKCLIEKEYIKISVIDSGKGFDIDHVLSKLGPLVKETGVEHLAEGGLGLFLIHNVMDEVEISKGQGVVLTMTKYVKRDGVAGNVGKFTQTRSN